MTTTRCAPRIQRLKPSMSISIAERVQALRREGAEIIDLSWGEPDFPTPPHIVEAAQRALAEGATKYTASAGVPELRQAIAETLARRQGLTYAPSNEIIVTPGGKQALLNALLTFVGDGDEVVVPEPCWLSYADCTALAGGVYVGVPSTFESGFKPRLADWEAAINERTRVLIVNSPTNPTGAVWSREDLEAIAELARRHDLLVISDELYESIIFDGREHVSIATFPGMRERTIVLGGFSKAYAMTGWRLGYLAGPAELVRQVMPVHQHSSTCAAAVSQAAGIAALRGTQEPVHEMVGEYQKRRDVVDEVFSALPGLRCFRPAGTFYAMIDTRAISPSSLEAARFFLDQARVATVPGAAYGESGEGYLRLSIARPAEELRLAAERVAAALAARSGA